MHSITEKQLDDFKFILEDIVDNIIHKTHMDSDPTDEVLSYTRPCVFNADIIDLLMVLDISYIKKSDSQDFKIMDYFAEKAIS
jgi:hypothetical protein